MEDARVAAETIELCLRAFGGRGNGHDEDDVEKGGRDDGGCGSSSKAGARHKAILHAFRLVERRRKRRAHRIQFESLLLATMTVNHAASAVLRAVRDAGLRWAARRSERCRLPIFDFLANYRTCTEVRLGSR